MPPIEMKGTADVVDGDDVGAVIVTVGSVDTVLEKVSDSMSA